MKPIIIDYNILLEVCKEKGMCKNMINNEK